VPTADENKQIVRSAYEGVAGGDAAAFFAALHPDVEVHEPPCLPYGGVYRGQREVIGMMREAAAHLAPGKLAIRELIAEGDSVVALLTLGLRDGSDALVTEVWRLRDGKAAALEVSWYDPTVV